MNTTVAKKIEEKLTAQFSPSHLEVIDESHLHQGHVGARPEGETHFKVSIVSDKFAGLSRVQTHRMINEVLATELAGPVHALSLKTKAP